MRLRVPGLFDDRSWLSSICFCLHSAQGILAIYFQLYRPAIRTIVGDDSFAPAIVDREATAVSCRLAVTWRQVKRIMMSVFVIVLAHAHGELSFEETSRYMAMARLLLEYPRWRWGERLDEAVNTVVEMANLGEINMIQDMKALMPDVEVQKLHPLQEVQGGLAISSLGEAGITGDGASTFPGDPYPAHWPTSFDFTLFGDQPGVDVDTIEDQTLFGLWDNIDFAASEWPWT